MQPRHVGVEQATADVGDDVHVERGELADRRVLDETLDPIVAGMDLEYERDVVAGAHDRTFVVRQAGAVGRADVDQPGARLFHHLRHAEGAADLDRLAPRHGDIASLGQRRQHEQYCGGVVVHDHRRFGATQAGEQLADGTLARPASTAGEIELDGLWSGRLGVCDGGSPEVGVQQHAGGVDHGGQQRSAEGIGAVGRRSGVAVGDRVAGDVDQDRVRQARAGQRAGECVDRRRSCTRSCAGLAHRREPTLDIRARA